MLGSESSTLLSLPGTKVPGNESSTYGTFAPGSESTRERKFHNSDYVKMCSDHAMA